MSLSAISIKRPITVIMITLMFSTLGFISIKKLPLLFFPEIDWPSLRVRVDYPSSSPDEVEQDITRPLEDILSTVTQLKSLTSVSNASGSNVSLEFDYGVNMDLKALEVRDKIDQIRNELPDGIRRIRILRWQTSQSPIMYFSLSLPNAGDTFYETVENVIKPRLERIDGVANVDIRGLAEKEVYVDVNAKLLHTYGLDMYNLAQSIRANNLNVSSGWVMNGNKKYFLRVVGAYDSLDQIRNQPIKGTNLFIKDIATVRYTFPEKDSVYHLNGHDAVGFRIYKASTANVVDTCRAVREELSVMKTLSQFKGMEYRIFRDSSREILDTLNNLSEGGFYGGILAVIIMFLFLWKFRSTFILALSIPTSVLFTFAGMFLVRLLGIADITINIISLMGMVFAVGMIVDCSIVVLENIFRHKQEEGLDAMNAALVGSSEVGMAVSASTLTTVIVFVPLVFASNTMFGKFMKDFGITVTLALVSSLAVSLTLVPMLSSRLYTGKERKKIKPIRLLTDFYGRFMGWTLKKRYLIVWLLIPLLWGSFYLFSRIEREDLPHVSARDIRISVLMPSNYTLSEMEKLFSRIERVIKEHEKSLEIESFSTSYGKTSRRLKRYSGDLNIFFTENGESLTPVETLKKKVLSILPREAGVDYSVGQMRHFGRSSGGFSIELRGDNEDVLNLYAQQVKDLLMDIPGVEDVTTDTEGGDEELHFRINSVKARKVGLTARRIAMTISSALSERNTTRYKTSNGEVDVIVRFRKEDRSSTQGILNLKIASSNNTLVPLYSVVEPVVTSGPKVIRKDNHKRIVTISANTSRAGMMWLMGSIQQALQQVKLPPGYSWQMGRSFRRFRESMKTQTFAVWLALIFIYLVMASLFESLVHPITILFTVPFAISGVSIVYWITNTQLSSLGYLGIMLLCGLVVNNAIILVDHVNTLRRKGVGRFDAIIKGGRDRLRPILMTALTTLFGLLPMVAPVIFPQYFGAVSFRARQWAPVALALVGGLTTSTFLTLVILPVIYNIVDDISGWLKKVFFTALGRA